MTQDELKRILDQVLTTEQSKIDPPTKSDWDRLEARFRCHFGHDFKNFIALMSKYSFPGDIFKVSSGKTNGNDSIELVYDSEVENGCWQEGMIPFYGIGNGDYFCLSMDECPSSPVYYYYADRQVFEPYSISFEEWIRQLPAFLNSP